MIKLVAFDWNGTLLSDTSLTWKVSCYAFKKMGLKAINFRRFQETFDVPIIQFYASNGLPKTEFLKRAEFQAKTFHERYEKLAVQMRSRSGTRLVLLWLKNNNIESVIYSNHTMTGLNSQLERLKLIGMINKALANPFMHSAQLKRGKDQRLADYIKQNGFKAKEVISVGDTEEEIQIGKAYGFHTVAITGGFNSTRRLKKHHPDFLINNLKELIPIIKKLNSN